MGIERYTLSAIILHWLHAVLVIALLVIGWTMTDLPKGPLRTAPYALHKSLGLCALTLVLIRLAWRNFHVPPAGAPQLQPWERKVSVVVHRALYLDLVVTPAAGLLSASFTKHQMKFFGLVLPSVGWPENTTLNAIFNNLHKGAVWILLFLLCLHVLGAIHHGLRRDGVVSRMLPGSPR
ncbi:MAG: cytochrome b [Giesbergeria sp.]